MSKKPTDASDDALTYAMLPAGVLRVTGADRVDLLHRLSTQDLRPLRTTHKVAQTLFTTAQGKALAWAHVLSTTEALLVLCPLPRVARLMQWIETYTIMEDVQVTDVSDKYAHLAVFGARAQMTLGLSSAPTADGWQACFGRDDASAGQGALSLLDPCLGAGLMGLVPTALTEAVHTALQSAGATVAQHAQLEERRLLAGMPAAAYELAGEPNPLEMRLGQACISWKKGCYIGQEVISRLDSYDKVARLLMGFKAPRALPDAGEAGHKLMLDGRPIGRITSHVATPEGCIGLALVKRTAAGPCIAHIETGDVTIAVTLEHRPFWAAAP